MPDVYGVRTAPVFQMLAAKSIYRHHACSIKTPLVLTSQMQRGKPPPSEDRASIQLHVDLCGRRTTFHSNRLADTQV